jgi:choline/glycine/proline betaine transport protein
LAIILLLVGGLEALQSATIMSALPFTIIMLLICWGLIKALHLDVTKMHTLQAARITPRAIQNPRSWQQRLGLIMHYSHTQEEVQAYIQTTVNKAFLSFQNELKRRQLQVKITKLEQGMQLQVDHQDEMNFIYQVVATKTLSPSFMSGMDTTEENSYQAEVFLREGGQGYDVMEWTQEDLLQDIIDQYERHLHFLSVVRTSE